MTAQYAPHIDSELVAILESVSDPEIPVLTVLDLGVIREAILKDNTVHILLTPTYSGCPAMDVISEDLAAAFKAKGLETKIDLVLHPAWSTDWISQAGREKMQAYGIAPPLNETHDKQALLGDARLIACPQCKSTNTKLVSQFGSTACKALFKCEDCLEPFDYFKCLR
ncbi:MAG: 1,2-phenylacetyl-CoA epoxidase subunit PaaD [Gilvibacter sp.]